MKTIIYIYPFAKLIEKQESKISCIKTGAHAVITLEYWSAIIESAMIFRDIHVVQTTIFILNKSKNNK